jgi:hypothetical protein
MSLWEVLNLWWLDKPLTTYYSLFHRGNIEVLQNNILSSDGIEPNKRQPSASGSACRLWTERSQVRAVASTHCTMCGKDLPLITSPRSRTVREPTALGTSFMTLSLTSSGKKHFIKYCDAHMDQHIFLYHISEVILDHTNPVKQNKDLISDSQFSSDLV